MSGKIFFMVKCCIALATLVMISGCAELQELRKIKTVQETRIGELEKQNSQYKDAFYNLKSDREKERLKYEGEIENLNKDLRFYQQGRSDRENRLSDDNALLRRNLQATNNDLAASKDELKKQKDDYTSKMSEMGGVLAQKESDLKKTQEENANLSAEIDSQKVQVSILESDIASKKTEIDALKAQIVEKDNGIAALKASASDLESKLSQSRAEADAAKSLKAELERLKKERAENADPGGSGVSLPDGMKEEFNKALAADAASNEVQVLSSERGLIVRLFSDELFDPGSVIIGENAKPLLGKVIGLLKKYPDLPIMVEGHTDNIPIQNLPFMDNLALSSARADNVVRYLNETGDIESRRLKSVACSWFHPAAPNDTPEGRRQNRRVDIIIGGR